MLCIILSAFHLSMLCCRPKTIITYNRFVAKLNKCYLTNALPSVTLSDFEGSIICSTSISRSMPPRLLLPFLTGSMGSCPKPRATSGVHQQRWTLILYPPTDGSGILTRVGDLDSLLSYFENTWLDGGQYSPAKRSVLNWSGLKQTK